MKITSIWADTLALLGRAWWVEIFTVRPQCTYYFGPFAYRQEAKIAAAGYVEDLENESAEGIKSQIKRCKPDQLTIDHDT